MNRYHHEFESYFLQTFLSKKIEIDIEDVENQNYFFSLSKTFQFSSYLLRSLEYSKNTLDLKQKLKLLSDNYLKKSLLMKYEIFKIVSLFNENNIEYVVLKGMAIKIKKIDSCRQFRDLDILVKKKDLTKSYELLKTYGYTYYNNESNDSTKYLRHMHHLPPMVNESGITVELHHRITLSNIFKECPLTNKAFIEKEVIDGICVPSNKILIAHSLSHGILHHKLMSGPTFLLDIKNLLMKGFKEDKSLDKILEKLDLTNEYNEAKLLIESCKHKDRVDDLLIERFDNLFKGNNIFPMKMDFLNKKSSLFRLIQFNSYYFQLPYWSPKLIFFLFKKYIES